MKRHEKRILQQVIDILLDKEGLLFKRAGGGEGKDAWYIGPSTTIEEPSDIGDVEGLPSTLHSNAVNWLACANAKLHEICNETFGCKRREEPQEFRMGAKLEVMHEIGQVHLQTSHSFLDYSASTK